MPPTRPVVVVVLAVALAGGCAIRGGRGGDRIPADAAATPISRIQGPGHVSPLADGLVVVTGVVTAVGDDGFYLQDRVGDGDPSTSDAIFVTTEAAPARSPGDSVRVAGIVRELVPGGLSSGNLSVTTVVARSQQLVTPGTGLPSPVVLGSGGRIPPQVRVIGLDELPVDLRDPEAARATEFDPHEEGIDFWESLEGMLVRVPDPVTVAPARRFEARSGELWVLSEGGAHVTPDDARTFRGGILLQPHPTNRGDQNPERIQLQYDPRITGTPVPLVATGASLGDATGVVSYAFGNFEVVLIEAPVPGSETRAPESTDLAGTGDRLTVATYNVLNLNLLPETAARMRKLGAHLAGRLGGPDIVALQEIQDEGGTRGGEDDLRTNATGTLRALADAVRAAGGPAYEFFDVAPAPNASGGAAGGNIRNAFLWNPERVDLVDYRSLTPAELRAAGARDLDAFRGSRNPLAGRFAFRGDTVIVIGNHLSSRFGSSPIFGARQPFLQAGEEAREAQARALHDVVASLLAADPEAAVVVLGDMNTFEWTDDLDRLLSGPEETRTLHNLVFRVPAGERYSYIFEGNSQQLDHVFVTAALLEGAELDVVHTNADYPEGSPPRASDHEPLVARLRVR